MKKIALSVHDVTPRYQQELEIIFAALDHLGATSRTELIVPDFQRQYRIDADPAFIAMIRAEKAKGVDVSLHGIHHDYAEYFRFDYDQARVTLEEGLRLFRAAFGFDPPGFVAPQWLQSRGSLRTVREHGFEYTATLSGMFCRNGARYWTFPHNFDWGVVWVDKLISCRNKIIGRLRRSGVIRFDIHPMDIPDGVFEEELRQLRYLLEHGWQAVSCEQLAREDVHA